MDYFTEASPMSRYGALVFRSLTVTLLKASMDTAFATPEKNSKSSARVEIMAEIFPV